MKAELAIILGIPEWIDETEVCPEKLSWAKNQWAREVEQLKKTSLKNTAPSKIEKDTDYAARYYWAKAYVSLNEIEPESIKKLAGQAKEFEKAFSPESRLLEAIFNSPLEPSPKIVQLGEKISIQEASEAKFHVLSWVNEYEKSTRSALAKTKQKYQLEKKKRDSELVTIRKLPQGKYAGIAIRDNGEPVFFTRGPASALNVGDSVPISRLRKGSRAF